MRPLVAAVHEIAPTAGGSSRLPGGQTVGMKRQWEQMGWDMRARRTATAGATQHSVGRQPATGFHKVPVRMWFALLHHVLHGMFEASCPWVCTEGTAHSRPCVHAHQSGTLSTH
eukprot:scaffold62438_cov19-Tisochrysis_lutea.AAC.1